MDKLTSGHPEILSDVLNEYLAGFNENPQPGDSTAGVWESNFANLLKTMEYMNLGSLADHARHQPELQKLVNHVGTAAFGPAGRGGGQWEPASAYEDDYLNQELEDFAAEYEDEL